MQAQDWNLVREQHPLADMELFDRVPEAAEDHVQARAQVPYDFGRQYVGPMSGYPDIESEPGPRRMLVRHSVGL